MKKFLILNFCVALFAMMTFNTKAASLLDVKPNSHNIDGISSFGNQNNYNRDVHVNSYINKNNNHIDEHYRSRPNDTKLDNWSIKGNINPYTGKAGTKSPW